MNHMRLGGPSSLRDHCTLRGSEHDEFIGHLHQQ